MVFATYQEEIIQHEYIAIQTPLIFPSLMEAKDINNDNNLEENEEINEVIES